MSDEAANRFAGTPDGGGHPDGSVFHRSDSGAASRTAFWGSSSGSPVNSRLAWFQSDFDTSCIERPLMAASSTARSRTIFRVTVPRPAEFSVKAPCFSGLVFIRQRLPRVKCLVVVRRFHFARAAILARVAGFGKNVVPFWRFWIGCLGIGPQAVKRLREYRRLCHGGEL